MIFNDIPWLLKLSPLLITQVAVALLTRKKPVQCSFQPQNTLKFQIIQLCCASTEISNNIVGIHIYSLVMRLWKLGHSICIMCNRCNFVLGRQLLLSSAFLLSILLIWLSRFVLPFSSMKMFPLVSKNEHQHVTSEKHLHYSQK